MFADTDTFPASPPKGGRLALSATFALQEADIGQLVLDGGDWGEPPKRHPRQREQSWVKPGINEEPPIELPADFFASSDNWVIDPLSVVWTEGVVVARRSTRTIRRKPAKRVVLAGSAFASRATDLSLADPSIRRAVVGLRLRASEVHAILGERVRSNGNAEPTLYDLVSEGSRAQVLQALIELIESGKMNEHFGAMHAPRIKGDIADFIRAKVRRPHGKRLSPRTALLHAAQIWDLWSKADSALRRP